MEIIDVFSSSQGQIRHIRHAEGDHLTFTTYEMIYSAGGEEGAWLERSSVINSPYGGLYRINYKSTDHKTCLQGDLWGYDRDRGDEYTNSKNDSIFHTVSPSLIIKKKEKSKRNKNKLWSESVWDCVLDFMLEIALW